MAYIGGTSADVPAGIALGCPYWLMNEANHDSFIYAPSDGGSDPECMCCVCIHETFDCTLLVIVWAACCCNVGRLDPVCWVSQAFEKHYPLMTISIMPSWLLMKSGCSVIHPVEIKTICFAEYSCLEISVWQIGALLTVYRAACQWFCLMLGIIVVWCHWLDAVCFSVAGLWVSVFCLFVFSCSSVIPLFVSCRVGGFESFCLLVPPRPSRIQGDKLGWHLVVECVRDSHIEWTIQWKAAQDIYS